MASHRGRDLADAVQSLGALADAAVKAELDGMVGGQRQDPCRDMKLQLGQRELVEDRLEDIPTAASSSSRQLTGRQHTP